MVAVPDGILWRQFSFLRRLVIEPAQALAFGVAAILAATSDLGAWSLVAGQYASHGVEVILVWTLARWRPRPSLASFGMWRELVGYGRHVFLATTILRAGEQSDAVIIGRILGAGALGQFRYAYRVASTPFLLILAAASFSIFPAFARIAHDAERMSAAFLRSLRWMMAVAAPAGLFLVALGLQLTVLVFGDVWRPAGYAAMAMAGFAVGGAVTSLVSELLRSQERPAALTPMHATTAIATIVSMALLAEISLTAAAAGLTIGPLVGAAYGLRVAHKITHIGVGRLLDAIVRPVVAASVMAGAVLALDRLLIDAADKETIAGLVWTGRRGPRGHSDLHGGVPDPLARRCRGCRRRRPRRNRELAQSPPERWRIPHERHSRPSRSSSRPTTRPARSARRSGRSCARAAKTWS